MILEKKYKTDVNNMQASIIIPTFNNEKYLKQCIHSLITQKTELSYEIVIVDDGSNDNTAAVCKDLQSESKNIVYIYQNNEGVSSARNNGIAHARGTYIIMVDSDDVVYSDYVESIVGLAIRESLDMVASGYEISYLNDNRRVINTFTSDSIYRGKQNIGEAVKKFGSNGLLNVAVCKCFRKSIIDNNKLQYDINLKTGEDLIFNIAFLSNCDSVGQIKKSPYEYIRRDEITGVNSYKPNMYVMVKKILKALDHLYCEYNLNDKESRILLSNFYLDYISNGIYNLYRKDCKLKISQKSKTIEHYFELASDKCKYSDRQDKLSMLCLREIKNNRPLETAIKYQTLFWVRNNFSELYIKKRQRLLGGDRT